MVLLVDVDFLWTAFEDVPHEFCKGSLDVAVGEDVGLCVGVLFYFGLFEEKHCEDMNLGAEFSYLILVVLVEGEFLGIGNKQFLLYHLNLILSYI